MNILQNEGVKCKNFIQDTKQIENILEQKLNTPNKYDDEYKSELKAFKLLFKDILEASDEQLLIKKETIIKTIYFMLEEVDEEDPRLIEFVKQLIEPPLSDQKLNLTEPNRKDFSQKGQSKIIDDLLGSKRNGFFIEAGGFDGEFGSNTLFFEIERNWTGILIEPIPKNYELIKTKNRNIHTLNACIANKRPIVAKFRVLHVLSGRLSEMSDNHKHRIDVEGKSGNKRVDKIAYIPCFSLVTILKAIGINKVDYFSLDVEGGEFDIIKNLDLRNKLDIKSFSIEHNGDANAKNNFKTYFKNFGYSLNKEDSQDIYFYKS
jgi:FkbM family methyltransferase